jgi:hypothetical protein
VGIITQFCKQNNNAMQEYFHRHLATFTIGLFFACAVNAQLKTNQASWQQKVDYYLDVTLNDENNSLDGVGKYEYTNHSPNELKEVYFHLWPNAYKDNTTDFAIQQRLNGNTSFYFAKEDQRGYIDGLRFAVDGIVTTHAYLENQPDICVLKLTTPIKPGQTVEIVTPFHVKISADFSRFGHVEQNYQITQWYPKPAVYDINGWNPMPYLDQGEFYSEFGRFEVKITLPKNYLVAATGALQEQEEIDFINQRIKIPIDPTEKIPSSGRTKTITFIQDNVHDFAWFASKTFNVEKSDVKLKNGQVVTTYVYASDPVIKATGFIHKALQYYSDHTGYYPYAHCTVVKGSLKAGGGMEYPMITVVNDLEEGVIVHEVGHNWFYGIIGSNERMYPWMDESINTYFEGEALNPSSKNVANLNEKQALKFGNDQILLALAEYIEQREIHQAIGEESKLLESGNYGYMVYGKGAHVFKHLGAYLGSEVMDQCFQNYFDQWKFKHPLPGDIRRVFEETSKRDLGWFFEGVIQSELHVDYALIGINTWDVKVVNKGGLSVPYSLGYFLDGNLVKEVWFEGHAGETLISHPNDLAFDLIKLDPRELLVETNRQNNTIRKYGAFKTVEPIKFSAGNPFSDPNSTNLLVSPIIGWNCYNKFMIGARITNKAFNVKKFDFTAAPLFSSETGDVNGYLNFAFHKYFNNTFSGLHIGAKSARFAFSPFSHNPNLFTYNRIAPFVKFEFRNPDKRFHKTAELVFRPTITAFSPQYDEAGAIQSLAYDTITQLGRRSVDQEMTDQFYDLWFEQKNKKSINPSSYKIGLQLGMTKNGINKYDTALKAVSEFIERDTFIRFTFEYNKRITYSLKNKGLDMRFFFGTYLNKPNNGNYQYRIGSQSGRYDYTFSQTVMGRNADEGLFANQITPTDMYQKLRGNFGNISGWVASANFKSGLPGKLPLKVYLDLFTFQDIESTANNDTGDKFGYSGGLQIDVIPSIFEIYMPLVTSSFITETQDFLKIKNFGQRITFMLNLNLFGDVDPLDVIDKVTKLAQ